jgi:putative membrane protein insertion efficiency factor
LRNVAHTFRVARVGTPKGLRYLSLAIVVLIALIVLNAQPLALAAIHGYQLTLSPAAARIGLRCRFTPTCSRYAETVIARDGVVRGGWKAVRRVARCGPWTAPGTIDPP